MEKYCNNVEIKTDGGFANIFIDGTEINGVRGFVAQQHINGAATLLLEMNVLNLTLNGKFVLQSKDYPDEEMMFVHRDDYEKKSMFYADHYHEYPEPQIEAPEDNH